MTDILNLCSLESSFKEFSVIVERRRNILYNSSDVWLKSDKGYQFDTKTIELDHTLDTLSNLISCLEDWNKSNK